MPELPEVEVVRRTLEGELPGRRIVDFEMSRGDLREPVGRSDLEPLVGRTIEGIGRRAKYLQVTTDGPALVIHLGMSGRLTVVAEERPRDRHEHVAWRLDDGRRLRFVDPRRFGLVLVLEPAILPDDRHFSHLGIEPLGEGFDGDELLQRAEGKRGAVKGFLMDARNVVGIGNIYASEVLFRAGIHPRRSVARISGERWHRLADAIREVLGEAVVAGGTTLSDYVDGNGRRGGFQRFLSVYGREGESCPRCRRPVRRVKAGGRSTFYCPGCQR